MHRILCAAMVVFAGAAVATETVHQHQGSPYAGADGRAIKALSERQVDDLLAGRGMSLALTAELNRHPGPVHVLELADRLGLTAAQTVETQALRRTMAAEAQALGRDILTREAALDQGFAAGRIDEAALAAATDEIGRLNGQLRFIHLKYHLAMKRLLAPEQVARYDELRGYRAAAPAQHRHNP
jgi:Spy/CpxP family protein refolding chaperone